MKSNKKSDKKNVSVKLQKKAAGKIGHELYKSQESLPNEVLANGDVKISVIKEMHNGKKRTDSFLVKKGVITNVKNFKGNKRAYHEYLDSIGAYAAMAVRPQDVTSGAAKDDAKGEWCGNVIADIAGREDLRYGAKFGFYKDQKKKK